MKRLPDMLRRLPFVFYGLAALFFIWGVINAWMNITAMNQYADPSLEGKYAFQKSEALYRIALESVYLVSSGGLLHILIAIYDKITGPDA